MSRPNDFDTQDAARKRGESDSNGARWLGARAVAVLSAVVIVFCAWAAWGYAQGSDPLAFLGSGAFQTVAEEDVATTGAAATVGAGASEAVESKPASSGAAESDEAAQAQDASSTSTSSKSDSDSKGDLDSSSNDSDDEGGSGASTDRGSSKSASSSSSSSSSSASDSSETYSGITVSITVDGSSAGSGSASATVGLSDGATVYDALLAAGADVNASSTAYGMYVSSIGGLAEKEHGSMSGWMYSVNGSTPNVACSSYTLSDGDSIYWWYANVEY